MEALKGFKVLGCEQQTYRPRVALLP